MQDQAAQNILDGADVLRALAGDQAAFATLYDRYFNRVYDFLARMLRDPSEAADVTQETFIQAMTALPSLKKPEGFKSWLFTIARNQALNRLERGKRVLAMPTTMTDDGEELTLDLVDEDRAADPSLPVLDRELAALVWEAAEGLDEKSYAILDLHVRQGLDSGELAEALGVTKGNAYTMLSRVKDRFEESLAVLIVSRRGRQECDILQAMVADVTRFTAAVRETIGKHIKACEICTATRRKFVVPFNIISGLAAPLPPSGLKERIWDDLMTRWPPSGADGGAVYADKDAVRMRRWWRTVRRRWPLSVAALALFLFGIATSFHMVLGDSAPPPTVTPIPPTATSAPPTQTPVPPTATSIPPTPVPSVTVQALLPLFVLPTPVLTATPIPPSDAPVPTAETPTEIPTDPPVSPTKPLPTRAPTAPPVSPTPILPTTETPIPPAVPSETPIPPTAQPATPIPTTQPPPIVVTVVPPFTPIPSFVPSTATATPVSFPTATNTPIPPPTATHTPIPPTATNTPVPPPTATSTAVPPPARLAVSPASGGRVPSGSSFTVTNIGGQPLTWSASVPPRSVFSLSSSGGTLAPGQSASVTVTGLPPSSTVSRTPISITSNGGSATLTAF